MTTRIHGIGSSEHLDSSGERISIAGMDISSLTRDGVFSWEHEGGENGAKTPSQIVGKILEAKKIFSEEDCENTYHLMFWKRCLRPFLYVAGELFDEEGHVGASEIAAILKYDAKNKDRFEKQMINFSIEGAKLKKEGVDIPKSVARKVTVTIHPCNKAAEAGLMPEGKPEEEFKASNFFKSENMDFEVNVIEENPTLAKLERLIKNSEGEMLSSLEKVRDQLAFAMANAHLNETLVKKAWGKSESIISDLRKDLNEKKITILRKNYDVAPSRLTGNAALAKEDLDRVMKSDTLAKGSRQKKMPFNPQRTAIPNQADNNHAWTEGGDWSDRENLADTGMDHNAKARALNKLARHTATRESEHGGREYLLHRGMGYAEYTNKLFEHNDSGTHYDHDAASSWTPFQSVANGFADSYDRPDHVSGHAVSAWVHENDIKHIPFQYGDPNNKSHHGYKGEGEVIVRGNTSPVVDPEEVEILTGKGIGEKGYLEAKPRTVNHSINAKADKTDDPGTLGLRNNITREYGRLKLGKSLKMMSKSEDLYNYISETYPDLSQKQVLLISAGVANRILKKSEEKLSSMIDNITSKKKLEKGENGDWKKEGYKISSTPHGNALKIHAHDSSNNLVGYLEAFPHENEEHIVGSHAQVSDQHKRKGIATAMYQHAEEKMGKSFHPTEGGDSDRTAEGRKLWAQKNRPFGKVEILKKGSLQSRLGNPKKHLNDTEVGKIQDWVHRGYSRDEIPEASLEAKQRFFQKLHSQTEVKRHPETGERLFLLHRGMGHNEANQTEKNQNNKVTSWTPDKKIANGFGSSFDDVDSNENGRTISAWIPESQIHNYTNNSIGHPEAQGQKKFRKEHEYLVKPHNLILNKTEILRKGSLQRKNPFNPKENDQHNLNTEWTGEGNHESKEILAEQGMEPNAKARALHKLSSKTPSRMSENGGREFLLHRGMSEREYSSVTGKLEDNSSYIDHASQPTSWTPHYGEASSFEFSGRDPSRTTSAWVHEDNMKFIPKQYGNHGEGPHDYKYEHEVLVHGGYSPEVSKENALKHIGRGEDELGRMVKKPQNVNQMINIRNDNSGGKSSPAGQKHVQNLVRERYGKKEE